MAALELIKQEKQKTADDILQLPIRTKNGINGSLLFITKDSVDNEEDISHLAQWRKDNLEWFPAQFEVTIDGTRQWLQKAVIDTPDRLLFWIRNKNGSKIGHVGLYRFFSDLSGCEIDNIVRGVTGDTPGIVGDAILAMLEWQRSYLKVPGSYLRVMSDNAKAVKLYNKLGYTELQRVPLFKEEKPGRIEWTELKNNPYLPVSRYFVTMKQDKRDELY